MRRPLATTLFCGSVLLGALPVDAAPIYYTDRETFLAAVGDQKTDDYSTYGVTPERWWLQFTDAEMSAVLGETVYATPTGFHSRVFGSNTSTADSYRYCAGCNGMFTLLFDATSLAEGGGVYGVALDILNHWVITGQPDRAFDAGIRIEFIDGSTETVIIPISPRTYNPALFFGITDSRGIRSLTFGDVPDADDHQWEMDNLTIARAPAPVPEPTSLALVAIGLCGAVVRRRRKARR